ncbi:MAG: iron ABC transporter permease [Sphaerochaetaceae bacterium]|nr:iron ABC transporter permease [Spirochaetales bacterium]MDY5500041.1 iron ABC transporter permease [Sphaerochaetaceae bacterium]
MGTRRYAWFWFFGGVALLVLAILSLCLGRYPISFPLNSMTSRVLWQIRLPRIILAMLAGLALSASGAAYQGVFQNPMASPDILGANNGAAFGAALAIVLGFSSWLIMACAFAGALLVVLIVTLLARRMRVQRTTGLILCGIMVGSLATSGTSFLKLVADPNSQLPAITYWLMGSLSGTQWKTIRSVLIPLCVGVTPLLLLRWKVDLLSVGDEEAASMGIDPNRLRRIIIIASTFASSSIIASCGAIGWVGLVIPHLARRLVGSSHKRVIPASMLLGAIFLLLVDDISRTLLETEIPLGILTAFVGAPFFLSLMASREVRHEH